MVVATNMGTPMLDPTAPWSIVLTMETSSNGPRVLGNPHIQSSRAQGQKRLRESACHFVGKKYGKTRLRQARASRISGFNDKPLM